MVIEEIADIDDDRRQHKRLPVRTSIQCRRLGRGGFDETVTSADISSGGALLEADRRLDVGDVVMLAVEVGGFALGLKGLVIATRELPGKTKNRLVHVAFTGLSPDRLEALGNLLDTWERESADG
jgi:hypothetical protein